MPREHWLWLRHSILDAYRSFRGGFKMTQNRKPTSHQYHSCEKFKNVSDNGVGKTSNMRGLAIFNFSRSNIVSRVYENRQSSTPRQIRVHLFGDGQTPIISPEILFNQSVNRIAFEQIHFNGFDDQFSPLISHHHLQSFILYLPKAHDMLDFLSRQPSHLPLEF